MNDHLNQRFFCGVIMALLCAVSVGCGKGGSVAQPKPAQLPPIDGPDSASQPPEVTVEEGDAFASKWIDCLEKKSLSASARLIDWTGIAERTVQGLPGDKSFKDGFSKDANQRLASTIVWKLGDAIQKESSYRLVNNVSRGGQRHLIFRLLDPTDGMNYHDLKLVKRDGKVIATHFFIATTGEDLADSLRNAMAPAAAASGTMGRLSGEQQRQMEVFKSFNEIKIAQGNGQFDQALAIFEKLPVEYKSQKVFQVMRLHCLSQSDDTAYLAALDEYKANFPNDPSIGLMMFDTGVLREDPEMLESCRQSIHKWTGGDPFVDLLVGGSLVAMGHVERAAEITKDVDPEPLDMADAHDIKMTIAMEMGDFDTTLAELRKLRDKFHWDLSGIGQAEGFEKFVQSPQYKEFMSDRP